MPIFNYAPEQLQRLGQSDISGFLFRQKNRPNGQYDALRVVTGQGF
jgi:hypothetical protein